MKNTGKQPTKRKRLGWKGKALIGLGVTFGVAGGGLYYLGEKTLEMEAQIDQTDLDQVCVTVGEERLAPAKDSLIDIFNGNLSDIFNAVQKSPLGKQLYDHADKHDLQVCYLDKMSRELHANAFVTMDNPSYMGYSLNMITSSTHSAAETTGHEFFHFYQRNNANAARFIPANAGTGDRLLRLMIMEAAAKTVGVMVLHEIDQSPEEKVFRWRLDANARSDLSWYETFLAKYKDQPPEDAKINAAKDMMRHLLTGDTLHDGWRSSYLKRLYMNSLANEKEQDISDEAAFQALYEELRKPQTIRFKTSSLEKLAELPDGRNIMPDVSHQDIIEAMKNTVKEVIESHELWPEKKNGQDTQELSQSSDNGRTKTAAANSWRQRLAR
jgi:hypothetical protein